MSKPDIREELERYEDLQERRQALAEQLKNLDAEIAETIGIIEEDVKAAGQPDVYSDRYHGYFKPGRKSTNHEAAAVSAKVPADIIEKHTTTKVTVAWAKVTKDAKVNVQPFTTQAPSKFVIEKI